MQNENKIYDSVFDILSEMGNQNELYNQQLYINDQQYTNEQQLYKNIFDNRINITIKNYNDYIYTNNLNISIHNLEIKSISKKVCNILSQKKSLNIYESKNINKLYKKLSLNNTIVNLSMMSCYIKDIIVISKKYFPNLKEVNLSFNNIKSIIIEDIQLDKLIASNNQIEYIKSTYRINTLNLETNKLKKIDNKIFGEIVQLDNNKLEILNINSNNIMRICYIRCNQLQKVYINSNSLETCYIDRNQINTIDIIAPKLHHLNINYNKIKKLILLKTNMLDILEASDNIIQKVNIKSDNLCYLNLDNNNINDNGFILDTPYIREIFLNKNKLKNLNIQNIFIKYKELDYIEIANNKMTQYKIIKGGDECTICLNKSNKFKYLQYCRHLFCTKCINNMIYLNILYKCPMCRGRIRIPDDNIGYYYR